MNYDKIKVGEYVKLHRLAKGWTQDQLAQISGISLRSIQRIENGEVDARLYTLTLLQEKLNFKLNETHLKAVPQLPQDKEKKNTLNRFQKILLSYGTAFTFIITTGIFLIDSISFPETSFEFFILISSIITIYSFIVLYIWRK